MTFDQTGGLSRRGFAKTALTAGFALAVQPVAQSAITTSADGLVAAEVKIPVRDGMMPGYWAKPANTTKTPVVLVVHEIFGVHEWVKDICRRFARAGYLAVAPDLFARAGDATTYTDIQKLIQDIVFKVPDDSVLQDLDATAAWVQTQGGDDDKMAVTGFCYGGRTTWLYTAHNPKIKAGVAWYGGLTKRGSDPRDLQPINVADKIKGRVQGLYAADDPGIPLEAVEAMRKALHDAGDRQSNIMVFNGAKHGFLADYRPSFNPAAAAAGWRSCLEWFKARGVV